MIRPAIFLILLFLVTGIWGLSFASKQLERVAAGVMPLDSRRFETTTVIAVGTGGTHENHRRLGPCIAVGLEETLVLVDAGRGLSPALRRASIPVAQPRAMLLTSLLPENTLGLADWLATAALDSDRSALDVLGPPGTRALVEGLLEARRADLAAQLTALGLPQAAEVRVREVDAPFEAELGPFRVSATPLSGGPLPALAWRVAGPEASVAVSGAGWDASTVAEFARGADVLIHEAISGASLDAAIEAGLPQAEVLRAEGALHARVEEIGDVATRAGVRKLALVRLRPPPVFDIPFGGYRALVAARFRGEVLLPEDGDEIPAR
jgi:ribonuclease BN (tRNA processing enzyme)